MANVGSPALNAAFNPFDGGTGSTPTSVTLAPSPSGGDDWGVLQALIDTVATTSGSSVITLRNGVYLLSAELKLPDYGTEFTQNEVILRGSGWRFTSGKGTVLRATAPMRSVVAMRGNTNLIQELTIDANRLATYGIYCFHAGLISVIDHVQILNAKRDGIFLDSAGAASSDTLRIRDVQSMQNGTVFYGSAAVNALFSGYSGVKTAAAGTISITIGSRIISGVGTSFTTLGLYPGDFFFAGASLSGGDWMMIKSVDSDTQITACRLSKATQNLAGAVNWAVTVGSGLRIDGLQAGVNGIVRVDGGNWSVNPQGIIATAQYGPVITQPHSSYNAAFAFVLGWGDNANEQAWQYSTVLENWYSESCGVADIHLGGVLHGDIGRATVSGNPAQMRMPSGLSFGDLHSTDGVALLQINGTFNLLSSFALDEYVLQSFVVRLTNPSGAQVQHSMWLDTDTLAPTFRASKINGATTATQNTPAVSNVVGFGGVGAGIVSGGIGPLVFDTNDQAPAPYNGAFAWMGTCSIEWNTTATQPLYCKLGIRSHNINGVTRFRIMLMFTGSAGTQLDPSAFIGAGKMVEVRVFSGIR